jgi:hypothetical protein
MIDKNTFLTVLCIADCGVHVEFTGTNAQRNVAVSSVHVYRREHESPM